MKYTGLPCILMVFDIIRNFKESVKQGNVLSTWWFSSILTHMSRWEIISLLWSNFCISGILAFYKNRFSDVFPSKKLKMIAPHLSCPTGSYYKTRQPTEWSSIDRSSLHVSSFQWKAVIYSRGSESPPSRKERRKPKIAWDFLRNRSSLDTLTSHILGSECAWNKNTCLSTIDDNSHHDRHTESRLLGERRQWEVDAVERSPCNLSSPEILIYKSPPYAMLITRKSQH